VTVRSCSSALLRRDGRIFWPIGLMRISYVVRRHRGCDSKDDDRSPLGRSSMRNMDRSKCSSYLLARALLLVLVS